MLRTARVLFWVVALGLTAGPAVADDDADKGLKDQALKLNKEASNGESADAKLKELLKDKPAAAKLVKAAAAMQKAAKEGEKPFRFYAGLVLAKLADNVKDYDTADLFYAHCTDNAINDLQSGKMIELAASHQLGFLAARKKYDKVEELCAKLLAVDGDNALNKAKIGFMERQIIAIAKQGEIDKAMEKVDKLLKAFDGAMEFVELRAQVQTEAGKYADAIESYKEVMKKVEELTEAPKEAKAKFLTGIRYRISSLLLDSDKFDEAVKILEELKDANPDNPTFYNDLGYLLADKDKRLEDAEKFVRKALELDAANRKKLLDEKKIDEAEAKKATPAYVDSMGWVLYKNKKYEEALPLLVEASQDEEEGNHIEIWDHVGDCQLALGRKTEALATFQKALKLDDVSKKDAERRKKITEKVKKLKAESK